LLLPLVPAATGGAVPAQAEPVPDAFQTLLNLDAGRCLGTNGSGTTVSLDANFCVGLGGQAWHLVPPYAGSLDYQIEVIDPGQPDDGWCLASNSSWQVYPAPCTSAADTVWNVTPGATSGSSAPSVITSYANGQCLFGAPGYPVELALCNGQTTEQWQRTQITGFKTTSSLRNVGDGFCLNTLLGRSPTSPVEVSSCQDPFKLGVWHLVPADHFGDWHIINTYYGWCLDSDYNGSTAARACNGGTFQTWQVTPAGSHGNSAMEITDVATGLCLDATVLSWSSTSPCDGSPWQGWTQSATAWDTTTFNLQNGNARGKCIGTDANTGLAGLWPCTTHPDQVWHFEDTNAQGFAELADGYGNCLGTQSKSAAQGAQLQAGPCTGSPDQYWVRSGLFLQNFQSGLVAGVLGASTTNGAPIVQWSKDTSSDQQWTES
jgi:hypothetical protein